MGLSGQRTKAFPDEKLNVFLRSVDVWNTAPPIKPTILHFIPTFDTIESKNLESSRVFGISYGKIKNFTDALA